MIPTPKVLIVAHADGYLEAFADKNIDVKFVLSPDVRGTQGELLAEQFVEHQLPDGFDEIYYPGCVVATGLARAVRPEEIALRVYEREIFDGLKLLHTTSTGGDL